MDIDTIKTHLTAAMDVGKELVQTPKVPDNFRPVVTIPEGSKVVELNREDHKLDVPRFKTAAPKFNAPDAFNSYVTDFKNPETRIFYTMDGKFTAVIDYHDREKARHADHTAELELIRSPEWEAWTKQDGNGLSQRAFAEFLEENAADIIEVHPDPNNVSVYPTPETMMSVAAGIDATVGGQFKSSQDLNNGSRQLIIDHQVDGVIKNTNVVVPKRFLIALRPFMGSNRFPIECVLRFTPSGEGMTFKFKMLRRHQVNEDAVTAIGEAVNVGTLIVPAFGAANLNAIKQGK